MANMKKIQEQIEQLVVDSNPNALFADGFEGCLLGCTRVHGRTVAVYSRGLCIKKLMDDDEMTHDEAIEFFEFNVEGAYVGPHTPIFLDLQIFTEGHM